MILRKKWGKGFRYFDQNGNPVKDENTITWIKSLVIPPAWMEVNIDTDIEQKIYAFGRDEAGKKQYVYNPDWRERQNQQKFNRMVDFAAQLTALREITAKHMRKRSLSRDKVLACMVRLIDNAYFRPGNPQYVKDNESYGLTTLRSKHLHIEDGELIFSYRGKSGKHQIKIIEDEHLSKVVAELDDLPGYQIFKYLDEHGKRVTVSSNELNSYIREHMGNEFSAKDFRTWAGTSIAAKTLDELGIATTKKDIESNIKEAIARASNALGNTPAVAKSSYIDPKVFEKYASGMVISDFSDKSLPEAIDTDNLNRPEALTLCMLHD